MRRLGPSLVVAVTFAVVLVVVLAPMALGKGAALVTIEVSGPGVDTPIVLEGEVLHTSAMDRVLAAIVETKRSLKEEDLPDDLGAKYLMTTTLKSPGGATDEVQQDFYPFAVGGPFSFTPPGQRRHGGGSGTTPVVTGWSHSPDILLDELQAEGFPDAAPEGTVPGATTSDVSSPPMALAWGILIGSIIVAAAMFFYGTKKGG